MIPERVKDLRITDLEKTRGKTVFRTYEGYGVVILIFTDGTFLHVGAEPSWPDPGEQADVVLTEWMDPYVLCAAEILTREEWEAVNKKREEERQATKRWEYERLKKEFEGGQ